MLSSENYWIFMIFKVPYVYDGAKWGEISQGYYSLMQRNEKPIAYD